MFKPRCICPKGHCPRHPDCFGSRFNPKYESCNTYCQFGSGDRGDKTCETVFDERYPNNKALRAK